MNPVYLRLLEIAEDLGEHPPVANTFFQSLLGLSSGRISQIADPLSIARLGPKGLSALANLGFNPDWVNYGPPNKKRLSLSSDTNGASETAESNAAGGPNIGRMLMAPVVGMAQLGDNGFWAELETPVGFGDGHIPFPAKSPNAYALRCSGDSMKPRIKNGEFVIVDPSLPVAPGDEVLVKASDGRVMVKELLYIRDNNVHLMSVNEAHGKLSIPLSGVECLHRIAGIMPSFTWEKG